MAKKILIATRNPGKKREIESLLANLPIEILSLSDYPEIPNVIEDAPTLEGNARKKASEVQRRVGISVLSDDTGLEVDALDGRPGVFSARYAGADGDAVANRALLLKEMQGQRLRTARFRTVIAYDDGRDVHFFEGTCEGKILEEERGAKGFGYDPLFLPDGESLTFAEMDPALKNRISHRSEALRKFKSYIQEHLDL